ncbi:serine/threonine-protein kinase [Streptomyces sp. NPDC049881]|uniref:serine/threonine-protein kinase n=1 Tax=Streptomyces sp. NPDC049881 TaxID=3155778 RepID=UPI00343F239D
MSSPQRRIAGQYRLVRELAGGGFGRIWQAHDEHLDVDVAVKEVWFPPAIDPAEHSRRLEYAAREARNAAKLRGHPHIVPVYSVVIEDDRPWIVMELVRGGSLADRLVRGPLPPKEVADVAEAMLKALDAARKARVVHRDVKPANIMLADDGRILLTDFGIAAHQDDTRLTTVGNVVGTPEYLAPECINGAVAGPASDLFALGVTLYRAAEGKSPFRRETDTAALGAVATQQPPPMKKADGLESLIFGLLDKDPEKRLTDAAALERLRGWRTGQKPPDDSPFVVVWTGREPLDTYAEKLPDQRFSQTFTGWFGTRRFAVPEVRSGWVLHVGPEYIMTTDSAERYEFTWDQILHISIREVQDWGPHQFTVLYLTFMPGYESPLLKPAGWPYPKTSPSESILKCPVCVLGPMAPEQRAELSEALARYGGRRWKPIAGTAEKFITRIRGWRR